jgi:hypothetical protein
MNTPTPSSERLAEAPTDTGIQPPTLASVAPDAREAANDDYEWLDDADDHTVNPLWMITIALGILVGVMALFVATG